MPHATGLRLGPATDPDAGGILQGPRVVVFDFAQAAQVDTSAAYAIDELITDAQAAGVSCYVAAELLELSHARRALGPVLVFHRGAE